jgi:hypothetical protein
MYSFFCYLHDNKKETDMCWIRQGLKDDNNLRMKVEYKIEDQPFITAQQFECVHVNMWKYCVLPSFHKIITIDFRSKCKKSCEVGGAKCKINLNWETVSKMV